MSYEQHHAALHMKPKRGGYRTDVQEGYDKYNTLLAERKATSTAGIRENTRSKDYYDLEKNPRKKKSGKSGIAGKVIIHPVFGEGLVLDDGEKGSGRLRVLFKDIDKEKVMSERWVKENCQYTQRE